MLRFRVGGEPRRVGREKSERSVRIFSILRKVEVNASDEVPGWIAALEELLYITLCLGQFESKGLVEFLPKRPKHILSQVFDACHWRRADGDELKLGVVGNHDL